MLEFKNFSKQYKNGTIAVSDLFLKVESGCITGFIGQNGAGKTTSLKAAAGILEFENGEIFIDGVSIKKDPVACKRVTAYIPDNPDLYDFLTGMQYIDFIGDVFRIEKNARRDGAMKYAEMFGIQDKLGELISSYSHGMKQKLAITSALMHEPKLLLLDEPFVGLDPKASHQLKQVFRDMCDNGTAIFFSTHVLDVAEKLCDKIAIIKQGRLIAFGDTENVKGDQSLEDVFLELLD